MRVQDLLSRLARVRRTTDRAWQATCPAHQDETPSLTVSLGEDGRVLVHCHAGCSAESVVEVLGLTLADLFQSAPSAGASRRSNSASHLPAVADWLRTARKISSAEIARMHARKTFRGLAVAFQYERVDGYLLYEKVRLIGAKKFWRIPARTPSVLYGLPTTDAANDRVIITEGELDVHALRSVGIDPVVSVPDGTGSQLTPELLAPLECFAEILIATDADEPGEKLARRLAEALGLARCRRLRFSDGDKTFKDAGDALKAGWARAQFDAAVRGAETFEATPSDDNDLDDNPYRVIGGRLCNIRTDRHGNETVQPLCNFNASIDEQNTRDDGNEAVSYYQISGRVASGVPLPPIQVNAADFGALTWISRWGHGPTIFAGNGKRDHLRVAIDTRSAPIRRCTYAHTGWREIDGKWVFLYHGGAVGADNVAVALEPPLDRVAFPDAVGDPVEAMQWSLRLLSCAPMVVVAPLLGAIYAAPLASILNPDFTLWLVGTTGSYKSELATLAQRHYGDFERTRLPASWCGTEASIETSVSVMKDVICVVDGPWKRHHRCDGGGVVVAYRLWLPGDPEPGTDELKRSPAVPAATDTPPALATKTRHPTAHDLFMTKVAPAFRRVVEWLEPLLADRWLGASERIRQLSPDTFEAINVAEECVDEIARRFMAGQATEAQFQAAVSDYEAAWRVGAAVVEIASIAPTERRVCSDCGAAEETARASIDDNAVLCRRCLANADRRAGGLS